MIDNRPGVASSTQPFDQIVAGVVRALAQCGWSEATGSGAMKKSFHTVTGSRDAIARLYPSDGFDVSLHFEFTSEGRNVAASASGLSPVHASEAQAFSLTVAAAQAAEMMILDSYAVSRA